MNDQGRPLDKDNIWRKFAERRTGFIEETRGREKDKRSPNCLACKSLQASSFPVSLGKGKV